MNKLSLILATTVLSVGTATLAEEPVPVARDKIAMLVIYGNDPCPRSKDDEIVVCSREPEGERYRIPEKMRHPKHKAADRSWGDRVRSLEMVSAFGRPNSCSPVGSNGQTGCFDQFLSEAREERQQEQREGPDAAGER